MPSRACCYIDLPDVEKWILDLGADAISEAATVRHAKKLRWDLIAHEAGSVLSAHQLADLVLWVATMFPEPGVRSQMHEPFLGAGVEFTLRFSAENQSATTWRRLQIGVGAFEQHMTLVGIRYDDLLAEVILTDVFRCIVTPASGCESWEELSEMEELAIINAQHDRLDTVRRILRACNADRYSDVKSRLLGWLECNPDEPVVSASSPAP